jgi:hypothetical protein
MPEPTSILETGPFVELDGPRVWVPRAVPYREAREVAKEAIQDYGQRIAYRGKTEAVLLGAVVDCLCDEVCARQHGEYGEFDPDLPTPCRIPAWAFEIIDDA